MKPGREASLRHCRVVVWLMSDGRRRTEPCLGGSLVSAMRWPLGQALGDAQAGKDPGIVNRFRQQQIAGASTRPAATQPARESIVLSIPIDPAPYQAAIDKLANDRTFRGVTLRGYYLLLAGRGEDACQTMTLALEVAGPGDLPEAMRAQAGCVGPANAYVLKAERPVVFAGDSPVAGWADLAQAFPKLKVANRGIEGDLTRGLLVRFRQDVLDQNPRAVVIEIGGSDLVSAGSAGDAAAGIAELVAMARKSCPDLPIVLCTLRPGAGPGDPVEPAAREAINAKIRQLAEGGMNIAVCELSAAMIKADGSAKLEYLSDDRQQLNQAGYGKWAGLLRPIFRQLGIVAGEPEDAVLLSSFEKAGGYLTVHSPGRWEMTPILTDTGASGMLAVSSVLKVDITVPSDDDDSGWFRVKLAVEGPGFKRTESSEWLWNHAPREGGPLEANPVVESFGPGGGSARESQLVQDRTDQSRRPPADDIRGKPSLRGGPGR